jgi:hypothetical protein
MLRPVSRDQSNLDATIGRSDLRRDTFHSMYSTGGMLAHQLLPGSAATGGSASAVRDFLDSRRGSERPARCRGCRLFSVRGSCARGGRSFRWN